MSRYTKKFYPNGSTATFVDGEYVSGTMPRDVKSGPYIMPDINCAYKDGGYQSPIDQTWIDSRSKLREHNIKHGVIHAGDVSMKQRMENVKRNMGYDPSLHGKTNWIDRSNRG